MAKKKITVNSFPYLCTIQVGVKEREQVPGRPTAWVAGAGRYIDDVLVYGTQRGARKKAERAAKDLIVYGESVKKITMKRLTEAEANKIIGVRPMFDLQGLAAGDEKSDAFATDV